MFSIKTLKKELPTIWEVLLLVFYALKRLQNIKR